MGDLNVRVKQLSFDSQALPAAKMLPRHQKVLQESLAAIARAHFPSLKAEGGSFEVRLDSSKKPLFSVNGQAVELPFSPQIKRVNRIIRFYQDIGHLPRQQLVESGEREEVSQTFIEKVSAARVPGTNANLWAGVRVADDTLSIYRKILAYRFGPNDPFASQLGYYAGSLWSLLFVKEIMDGQEEYRRAQLIGDSEGGRRAHAKLLSGGILTVGSLSYLSGKIVDEVLSVSTGAHLLTGSNLLFGVGALLGAAASSLGAYRCANFRKRLDEYLETPGLSDEQKYRGAVQFLKDSLVVSIEELAEIEETVSQLSEEDKEALAKQNLKDEIELDFPALGKEEKLSLLNQRLAGLQDKTARAISEKIKHLTEAKIKYMKRRTSSQSLTLILRQADDILAKLNDENLRAEGIAEAKELIKVVRKDNWSKMILYALGALSSILSFVGILSLSLTSGVIFPYVLMGIGSGLCVALWFYYYGPSLPYVPGRIYHWIKGIPDTLATWVSDRLDSSMRANRIFLENQRAAEQ